MSIWTCKAPRFWNSTCCQWSVTNPNTFFFTTDALNLCMNSTVLSTGQKWEATPLKNVFISGQLPLAVNVTKSHIFHRKQLNQDILWPIHYFFIPDSVGGIYWPSLWWTFSPLPKSGNTYSFVRLTSCMINGNSWAFNIVHDIHRCTLCCSNHVKSHDVRGGSRCGAREPHSLWLLLSVAYPGGFKGFEWTLLSSRISET